MVTALSSYLDSRVRADVGEGYDGIVRVAIAGYYGTGTLLYNGKAVLTAAHLFEGVSQSTATVYFDTASGKKSIAGRYSVISSYDSSDGNNDLALVWLDENAPVAAERYTLYRESDEVSQNFTMVGYGAPGSGSYGVDEHYSGEHLRLMTYNRFDADAAELKALLGSTMAWSPTNQTQLLADFDNGSSLRDALGSFLGQHDVGRGVLEGLIAPGDSGGPAFIDGKVAGVASYTSSLETLTSHPDSDDSTNSTFGEIAAWQRVSYYQQWIDQSMRAHYLNAPTQPSEVQKSVAEGDSGLSYAYFLVQFTGTRTDADDWVSVEYTTLSGTALAGVDFIATSGELILYPDENYAVIPVEIIGDTVDELNETFSLEIYNPIGGSFGEGIVKLTAIRTIVDDDGF